MEKSNLKINEFTKYEVARILGARSLQIAMDAPLLKRIPKEKLEEINYDPMKIAKEEFDSDVLPITVKQPFPKKKSVKIKKTSEKDEIKDKQIEEAEELEEREIEEEGEIMELATPEDEFVEENIGGRESSEELQ
ncbi:MAG: DNA-directed RNA polymerase subunit K [Candidatus Pacearchaeota archaeon]